MCRLRAFWRCLRCVGHVLRGLWIIRSEFGQLNEAQTSLLVREWSRQMLTIMGVKLVVQGTSPAQGPLLVVSNHISWLDILVMNAARPVRFVSKADVKRWPLLGSLITGAGTVYIERENRRDAMRVVHHVAVRLQANDVIAIFPEGTTGDGTKLLPFHANLFQAAIAAQAPVLPVALRFVHASTGEQHHAPSFIGDTTLVGSVWATLCATDVQAMVSFGQPQTADGRDRRTWAADMRRGIEGLLDLTPGCKSSTDPQEKLREHAKRHQR